MTVDLNDQRRADARGWGSGWPDCDESKWVDLDVLSIKGRLIRFPAFEVRSERGRLVFEEAVGFGGGVREEIRELVSLLLQVSERRGHINLEPEWCHGAQCRPIKLAGGGFTTTPSNHSWGLAVDLNAPVNPLGGTSHTIERPMADLWNKYGFRWGGDYSTTKDWMHFEFMGTPADAKEATERARSELSGEVAELTPEQEKAIKGMTTFLDTLLEELGKRAKDGEEGEEEKAAPAGAAKRVARAVIDAEKAP
jgi:hypothetical protein